MKQVLILFSLATFLRAQPEEHSFVHGGLTRAYFLYIPNSLEIGAPLLFVLHGYSGSASGIMDYTNLNQVAEESGFAVCYPQGVSDDWNYNFWNVGYDFRNDEVVDMIEAGIIDPAKVTRTALQNASSAAGTLITTSHAIIEV